MQGSLKVLPTAICCLFLYWSIPQLSGQSAGGTTPSITLPGSQSLFQGSAPEGNATSEILQIDFKDAIDRGLRNNLGLLLAGDQQEAARGERWWLAGVLGAFCWMTRATCDRARWLCGLFAN